MSTEKQGCNLKFWLIGCGSIILLVILLGVATTLWITQKGSFPQEKSILRPGADDLYVRMHLREDDKVLIDFFSSRITELQRLDPVSKELPNFVNEWQSENGRKKLERMLPLKVEVVGSEADQMRGSIGISTYNNVGSLFWWFMKKAAKEEGRLHQSEGVDYVTVKSEDDGPDLAGTYHDNIIYWAMNEESLQQSLANLSYTATEPDPRLAGLDPQAPVQMFMVKGATELPFLDLIQVALSSASTSQVPSVDLEEGESPDVQTDEGIGAILKDATRIAMDLSLSDQDTMSGKILIDVPAHEEIEILIRQRMDLMGKDTPLTFTYQLKPVDLGYQIDFHVTGFSEVPLEALESVE